ncbi:MAG: sigma-54 dependent transcriptional regulator [Planctomycetota bacterium]
MPEEKGKILVVDDEETMCELLKVILSREGYEITVMTDGLESINLFKKERFDIVIQDIKMPLIDGITLMQKFKEIDPSVIVIIITAFSSDRIAVEAMRHGAYDYIKKPFDNDQDLKSTLRRASRFKQILKAFGDNRSQADAPLRVIIGNSSQIKDVHDIIRRVSATDSTILIYGESGAGKELVARAIHYHSGRAGEPFITVNCGAFSENLLESELFGHVKGSFTSAINDKKGLLEVADKGTFFLDEVSELSPQIQVKLLRVLEEKEFKPVGSTETKKVDVRFVTATNTDLKKRVQAGTFREDLYYRLNVISINIPPLRERKDDIPLLAGYFLNKYSRIMKKNVDMFSPVSLQMLLNYNWPGNVRELENTIQRAVALTENKEIQPSDFRSDFRPWTDTLSDNVALGKSELPFDSGTNLDEKVKEMEIKYILKSLEMTGGQLTRAAQLLQISFRSLRYKIKKYGI